MISLVGFTTRSVWSKISSAAYPVVFIAEERETAIAELHISIDLEGGTEPDNFERAVEGNR